MAISGSDVPRVVLVAAESPGSLDGLAVERVGPDTAVDALAEPLDCLVCEHAPAAGVDATDVLPAVVEAAPDVPVLAYTAAPDGEAAAALTRAGADEYAAPATAAELAEGVRSLLADRATAPAADGGATARSEGDPRGPAAGPAFEAIADSIADGVVTVDESGTVVFANEGVAELTGYDVTTLEGGPLTRLMPERFVPGHEAGFEAYLETGERTLDWSGVELAVERADGEELPVAVSFGEFEHDGSRFFTGAIRDVSDRAAREQELERSRRQFEALFEHPGWFAAVLDDEGRILAANGSALSFAGVEESAVRGTAFADSPWWDHDAEARAEIRRKVEAALDGERQTFDSEHYAPDGERVVVDGLMQPVVDPDGDVERVVVAGHDVTGRAEATEQLRDRQASLRRLYEVMADGDLPLEERVRHALEVGCERLDLPYGFFTRIDDETQHVEESVGDHVGLQPGEEAPLSESYCRHTIESEGLVGMSDAAVTLGDDPALDRFGLGCYLGGKVVVDGELYGTLCFAGDAAREVDFGDDEHTFVQLLVEWLGSELERTAYRSDLEAARKRLADTLERIDDGFFAVDDDWTFTYVNERAGTLLDADPAWLEGRNIWDVFDDAVGTPFHDHYHEAMATQEPVSFEEHYEPLDLWTEVTAYPSEDGLSVFFKDIADRKRREEMLTGLVEATRGLMAAGDETAVAERVTEAATDLLGLETTAVRLYDSEADALLPTAVSDTARAILPERQPYDLTDTPAGEAFRTGESVEQERAADLPGPLTASLYLPLGEYGILSVGTRSPGGFDDDERRTAELLAATTTAALERAEREAALAEYEAAIENTRGMLFVADSEGAFRLVTEPLAERLGYDRETLTDMAVTDVTDDDVDRFVQLVDQLRAGYGDSITVETELTAADCEPVPVEVELSLLPAGHEGAIGVVRDISDLRATRRELVAERNRLETLLEYLPDPVLEVEFTDDGPVVNGVNPAFEETFGYEEPAITGENPNDLIVPDGSRADAEALDERSRGGEVVTTEVERATANGLRTFLFRGVTYELADGPHGVGIYTDITDQKERERRLQVLHTVLRHNLRTEMTLIQGFVDELAAEFDERPAALSGIAERVETVGRLSSEVQEMERVLDRGPPDADAAVDLVEHVEPVVAAAAERYPHADVCTDLPDRAPAAADDRVGLAVRNLVENAVQHSDRESPTVRVSVEADGEWVRLRVADDGPGIPDHEQELVSGRRDITQLEHGSGLGLWLVAWLARACGGRIRFADNEPRGAVVVVELLAAADRGDGEA